MAHGEQDVPVWPPRGPDAAGPGYRGRPLHTPVGGPAPAFAARDAVPVAPTHLHTPPGQVRPPILPSPPLDRDYSFTDVPAEVPSPASRSTLPRISTISNTELHEAEIQSATSYPEPPANVGPLVADDDKPLYVSMRRRGRPGDRDHSGSPSRAPERDTDSESEGSLHSRRSSLSQIKEFPNSNAESDHSRHSQDPKFYHTPPLNPNVGPPGRPVLIRPAPSPTNSLPTAQLVRPPPNLLPTAHQIRAPDGYAPHANRPRMQPRPGPRPGNPHYGPAMANQPGHVQVQARSIPGHLQPGMQFENKEAAERAARFGRNERGEPLQVCTATLVS
jgi:hypothetical protein